MNETPEARRLLLLIMAGLVGAATGRASADTFTVNNILDDGSVGSLRWAIGQANANAGDDTIDFDAAVFGTPQTIALAGTQLELTDTGGATAITGPAAGVTVDAGGMSRVFQIDALVTASISGMTITGGSVDTGFLQGGGGVFNQGTLSLTNCAVTGNSATDLGGGLSSLGSATLTPELTLTNCTVSNNIALASGQFGDGGEGGGVFNSRGTLTMSACTVTGNSTGLAFGIGGGVATIGPTTVTGCTFSGNRTSSGGGMWAVRTATITDCTFTDNYCNYGPGGGVFVDHCTATLTNCTMTGNRAGGYIIFDGGIGGGGLGVSTSTLTVTGCTISGNHSVTSGGGVAVTDFYGGSSVALDHCTVSGNSSEGGFFAGKGGGGVAVNFAQVTLTDCSINNNSTTGSDGGGGVVCSAGDARLVRCTVSGNTANKGAGVSNTFFQYYYYPPVPGSSTLTDCTVSGNTASDSGGGVSNDAECTLTATNCTINNNQAASRGGGIGTSGGTTTITGSRINSNEVNSPDTAQGAGIGSENTELSLTNCQINANRANGATAQGGGIFALTSTVTAGRCTVNGNRASGTILGQGGGIYSFNSVLTLPNSIVKGNRASTAFDNIFNGP